MKTRYLTILATLTFLGFSAPAFAPPPGACSPWPECKNGGGGDDGDDQNNLRAKFNLTIEMTGPQYVLSDIGDYQDSSKDHVQVSTASGPGFRFDTNTQNISSLSRWMKARHVFMTVADSTTPPTLPYEIDFRFNQRLGGLDLGSITVGDWKTVAASLQYFGGNQVVGFDALNNGILGFAALNATTFDEAADCLAAAGMIKVTRNTSTQWTLESVEDFACRFAIDASGDIECSHSPCGNPPTIIPFKFKFTIDEQV